MSVWNCSEDTVDELNKLSESLIACIKTCTVELNKLSEEYGNSIGLIGPHEISIESLLSEMETIINGGSRLVNKLSLKIAKAARIRKAIIENDRYRNTNNTLNTNQMSNTKDESFQYNGEILNGVNVKQLSYIKREKSEMLKLRNEFNSKIRKKFIKLLAEVHEKELLDCGMSKMDIEMMVDGFVPKGCQVHHIKPLDDSGDNDFNNLVLIDIKSHMVVTLYQNSFCHDMKAKQCKKIKWPFFIKPIYIRRL